MTPEELKAIEARHERVKPEPVSDDIWAEDAHRDRAALIARVKELEAVRVAARTAILAADRGLRAAECNESEWWVEVSKGREACESLREALAEYDKLKGGE